jgi:hypothetical protein
LGNIGEHIKKHTSVELNKIVVWRDSVWHFKNYNEQKWYDSKSVNYFFNIAYNDGSKRQAIARVVNDITQAGDNRSACKGKNGKIEFWRYCIYKHYEVYDPEKMQGPSDNLASVGMTEWQSPWAISDDKMYLDDVTKKEMVNKYAAADKWVRLPYVMAGVKSDQGEPRTKVEATASPTDYLWKDGSFVTNKTSIFNEPVLFMRVMWVEDNNNNVPNLVSTDGRKLTIVHMQNDDNLYRPLTQCVWVQTVYNNCYPLESCAYFLDNQSYNMWPGWPSPF